MQLVKRFALVFALCGTMTVYARTRAAWTEEVISCEIGTPLAGYNANDISVAKADDLMLCACGVDDGKDRVFLFVTNVTPVAVSGTVTLNEIFEKVQNVRNRFRAEIDGRWIEIELPPRGAMTLRLGK